jgi:hypothetical protein
MGLGLTGGNMLAENMSGGQGDLSQKYKDDATREIIADLRAEVARKNEKIVYLETLLEKVSARLTTKWL